MPKKEKIWHTIFYSGQISCQKIFIFLNSRSYRTPEHDANPCGTSTYVKKSPVYWS